MVFITARRSPSVLRNVSAIRSTSDCGRLVGHEPHGQFLRDEARGGGVVGHDIEHLFAVADAAAGGNPHAEHGLFAVIVYTRC